MADPRLSTEPPTHPAPPAAQPDGALEAPTARSFAPRLLTVAERVQSPEHAGALEGAERIGEAADDDRVVRIGVFADGRARFRATTCASLIAYAEAACEALEAGVAPGALDAAALRARVAGVHPGHLDRAALVAGAVQSAFPTPFPSERA